MPLALLALPFALMSHANAASYAVDPVHSRVGFSVVHMTISNVRGEFGTVSGTVDYDDKNVAGTKVSATVGVASVDTHDQTRDADLLSTNFFDATKFPNMTFTSKSAKAGTGGALDLTGDLTIHGVTREVTFHCDPFSAEIKDPWGATRRATHATATINRQDFGMNFNKTLDAGGYVVSDEVKIELDVEMKKTAG